MKLVWARNVARYDSDSTSRLGAEKGRHKIQLIPAGEGVGSHIPGTQASQIFRQNIVFRTCRFHHEKRQKLGGKKRPPSAEKLFNRYSCKFNFDN